MKQSASHPPFTAGSPPRVLFMAGPRVFPSVQSAILRLGGARGWRMRFGQVSVNSLPPPERYDGIFIIGTHPEMLAWAATATCPVVRIFDSVPEGKNRFPVVDTDPQASGRLGARHLLALGYKHLCFFQWNDVPWACCLRNAFMAEVVRIGRTPHLIDVFTGPGPALSGGRDAVEEWMASRLKDLPKPLALLTEDDHYAPMFVNAARLAGLRVPEDVAVLSPDGMFIDELDSSPIPISFINNHATLPVAAVALLEDLMARKPAPSQPILTVPDGIVARASTSFFVSDVPGVADAVMHMRACFRNRVSVGNLARLAGMSVRKLQEEIKKTLGHTIREELFRLRMDYARSLLRETDLKIHVVAMESGFADHATFYRLFGKAYGISPGKYRSAGKR